MEKFMSFNQGKDDTIEPAYMKNFSGSNNRQSELPAVTIEDNNKVLTVVNGEWDKADLPGGSSEPFIITGTYANGHYSINESVQDILDAVESNPESIIIIVDDPTYTGSGTRKFISRNMRVLIWHPYGEKRAATITFDITMNTGLVGQFEQYQFNVNAGDVEGEEKHLSCWLTTITIAKDGTTTYTHNTYQ